MKRTGRLRPVRARSAPATKVLPRRLPAGSVAWSEAPVTAAELDAARAATVLRDKEPPTMVVSPQVFRQLCPAPKTAAPIRDESFLSLVRTKPCLVPWCHAEPPNDPAHTGPRGVRQKTDDLRCVPACRRCHRFFDVNHYLPLDGPKTVPLHRAPGSVVRRLKLWTRLLVAETQRELLIEFYRESAA